MRTYPEDRRYMSYEQRAIDDPKFRGSIRRDSAKPKVCYCGKTVLSHGVTCPRDCEKNRPSEVKKAREDLLTGNRSSLEILDDLFG